MTTCNAQAGDKKGDERKAFMKTCLSRCAGEAGEQDGDVQQKDRWPREGRACQGSKRVHEGAA
jgi:hypothetical protein